jgi:hypothetical protein
VKVEAGEDVKPALEAGLRPFSQLSAVQQRAVARRALESLVSAAGGRAELKGLLVGLRPQLNDDELDAMLAPMQPTGGAGEVTATTSAAMQEQWDRQVAIYGPSITDAQLDALCTSYPGVASVNLILESEKLTNNGMRAMFSKLTSLTTLKLQLSSSGWTSISELPGLGEMTSLTTLDLENFHRYPKVTPNEEMKHELRKLVNLTSLRLTSNRKPIFFPSFCGEECSDSSSQVSPEHWFSTTMTALTSLKLDGGVVGYGIDGLAKLESLTNLSTLHLVDTYRYCVMDKALPGFVRSMPALTNLSLRNADITIAGVSTLTGFTNLQVLNLSNIGVRVPLSHEWGNDAAFLEDDAFEQLSRITTLTELDLSESGALKSVSMFKDHPNLTRLNVRDCPLENMSRLLELQEAQEAIRQAMKPRRKNQPRILIRASRVEVYLNDDELDAMRAPMQPTGGVGEATAMTSVAMQEQWDRQVAIYGPSITDAQLDALCTLYPGVASVNLILESEKLTNNGMRAMFSKLTSLTTLKLQLSSSGWTSISELPGLGEMTSLTTLDLENFVALPNEKIVVELTKLVPLTSLRLTNCGDADALCIDAEGDLELIFRALTALTSLKLDGGFMRAVITAEDDETTIMSCLPSKLSTLHLSNCNFFTQDIAIEPLIDIPTLTDLNLSGAGITIEGVSTLAKLPNLRVLNLSAVVTHLSSGAAFLENDAFEQLSRITTLTELDLSGNRFLDDWDSRAASMFKDHPNLTRLNVRPMCVDCVYVQMCDECDVSECYECEHRARLEQQGRRKDLPSIRILADEQDVDL